MESFPKAKETSVGSESVANMDSNMDGIEAQCDQDVLKQSQEIVKEHLGSMDAKSMRESAAQASALLKSLSHPDRLLLLCQLVQGEVCVQDIETLTGIKQPSLSQQLGVLRDKKLVTTRREGRQIYYGIASEDALAVMALLFERFCRK